MIDEKKNWGSIDNMKLKKNRYEREESSSENRETE
jgi:hypothetical protein